MVAEASLKFAPGSGTFGATQLFHSELNVNVSSSPAGGKQQSEQRRANLQTSHPSLPARKTSDSWKSRILSLCLFS